MSVRARSLEPIERMQVFRQVLQEITAYIDENNLKPGDRLPGDREFVNALRVSRPLVQQALKVLEGLGRVKIVHGLGSFVADDSVQVLAAELTRGIADTQVLNEQLLEARELIDSQAMRCAFRRQCPGLLDELRRILQARDGELADEPDEASLDLSFEAAFGRFCGNEVLARLQAVVHHSFLQAQIDQDRPLGDRIALHREHGAIFHALEAEDLETAMELFTQHVRGIRPGA